MKRFYLISTEHLEESLWFRDDEDFAAGMNYVAIESFRNGKVVVFAFILMSNHVHFLVYGERLDVERFFKNYKNRYSHYFKNKYGCRHLLLDNPIHIEEVDPSDNGVEWAAAYVIMNSVAANICAHPSQYPWGCAAALFSAVKPSGKRIGDYSARELRQILHSGETSLPKDWLISEHGFILPDNFIAVKGMEQRFKTPNRMNYFLTKSSKAKKVLSSTDNMPAFRDQTVAAGASELLRSLFGKSDFNELSRSEKTEFLRQIRFRFSADITQAARACGISYSEAADLFDTV
ncbi:MAG: hypothetical protein J5748_04045 [Bacteroidales bacterium]|nr:hypothetical protein [Bacteroidales bacterium]